MENAVMGRKQQGMLLEIERGQELTIHLSKGGGGFKPEVLANVWSYRCPSDITGLESKTRNL